MPSAVPQVQVEEGERVGLLDPYRPGRVEGSDPVRICWSVMPRILPACGMSVALSP
jgi:hypothetical protein